MANLHGPGIHQPSNQVSLCGTACVKRKAIVNQCVCPDCPTATVFDICNSSTQLVLQQTRCKKSHCHLRGYSNAEKKRTFVPDPGRHFRPATSPSRLCHLACINDTQSKTRVIPTILIQRDICPRNVTKTHMHQNGGANSPQRCIGDLIPPRVKFHSQPNESILSGEDITNVDYIRRMSRVYDMENMKYLKEQQYNKLLERQVHSGYYGVDELRRYRRYLKSMRLTGSTAKAVLPTIQVPKRVSKRSNQKMKLSFEIDYDKDVGRLKTPKTERKDSLIAQLLSHQTYAEIKEEEHRRDQIVPKTILLKKLLSTDTSMAINTSLGENEKYFNEDHLIPIASELFKSSNNNNNNNWRIHENIQPLRQFPITKHNNSLKREVLTSRKERKPISATVLIDKTDSDTASPNIAKTHLPTNDSVKCSEQICINGDNVHSSMGVISTQDSPNLPVRLIAKNKNRKCSNNIDKELIITAERQGLCNNLFNNSSYIYLESSSRVNEEHSPTNDVKTLNVAKSTVIAPVKKYETNSTSDNKRQNYETTIKGTYLLLEAEQNLEKVVCIDNETTNDIIHEIRDNTIETERGICYDHFECDNFQEDGFRSNDTPNGERAYVLDRNKYMLSNAVACGTQDNAYGNNEAHRSDDNDQTYMSVATTQQSINKDRENQECDTDESNTGQVSVHEDEDDMTVSNGEKSKMLNEDQYLKSNDRILMEFNSKPITSPIMGMLKNDDTMHPVVSNKDRNLGFTDPMHAEQHYCSSDLVTDKTCDGDYFRTVNTGKSVDERCHHNVLQQFDEYNDTEQTEQHVIFETRQNESLPVPVPINDHFEECQIKNYAPKNYVEVMNHFGVSGNYDSIIKPTISNDTRSMVAEYFEGDDGSEYSSRTTNVAAIKNVNECNIDQSDGMNDNAHIYDETLKHNASNTVSPLDTFTHSAHDAVGMENTVSSNLYSKKHNETHDYKQKSELLKNTTETDYKVVMKRELMETASQENITSTVGDINTITIDRIPITDEDQFKTKDHDFTTAVETLDTDIKNENEENRALQHINRGHEYNTEENNINTEADVVRKNQLEFDIEGNKLMIQEPGKETEREETVTSKHDPVTMNDIRGNGRGLDTSLMVSNVSVIEPSTCLKDVDYVSTQKQIDEEYDVNIDENQADGLTEIKPKISQNEQLNIDRQDGDYRRYSQDIDMMADVDKHTECISSRLVDINRFDERSHVDDKSETSFEWVV